MSVNKYRPHIHVLPEDDANRQIANGFVLDFSLCNRAIQVLDVAGGWTKVRDEFETVHVKEMEKYKNRNVVLLIDFDEDAERLEHFKSFIPQHLSDRVFIVGVWTEPEDLRKAGLGSFEDVGSELARECRDDSRTLWSHELLRHNAAELARMTEKLRPILFLRV